VFSNAMEFNSENSQIYDDARILRVSRVSAFFTFLTVTGIFYPIDD
jgi:hypothetical protein